MILDILLKILIRNYKMAYDSDFYRQYQEYLQEPSVRESHDWIFDIVKKDFQSVIDFGCGLSEFKQFAKPEKYIGIDLNAEYPNIKENYREIYLESFSDWFETYTSFVSLFSTEITDHYEHNYKLYQRIFLKLPNIKNGLVSGFYYLNKKHLFTVEETGGVKSYQTLEPIHQIISPIFKEKRIILPVPSKMFGNDVYEVWKIFTRN